MYSLEGDAIDVLLSALETEATETTSDVMNLFQTNPALKAARNKTTTLTFEERRMRDLAKTAETAYVKTRKIQQNCAYFQQTKSTLMAAENNRGIMYAQQDLIQKAGPVTKATQRQMETVARQMEMHEEDTAELEDQMEDLTQVMARQMESDNTADHTLRDELDAYLQAP